VSYRFVGQSYASQTGYVVLSADFDGDGITDLLIAEPSLTDPNVAWSTGELFLISGKDLRAADLADGVLDRTINMHHANVQPYVLRLRGLQYQRLGQAGALIGDASGDGAADYLVKGNDNSVYLISYEDFAGADQADGLDRIARILNYLNRGNSYRFDGQAGDSLGIFGADGNYQTGLGAITERVGSGSGAHDATRYVGIGGATFYAGRGHVYLVAQSDFAALDQAGGTDGVIQLGAVGGAHHLNPGGVAPDSYELTIGDGRNDLARLGVSIASAGDTDGDGFTELLIGAEGAWGDSKWSGQAFLLHKDDLIAADTADGRDLRIDVLNLKGLAGGKSYIFSGIVEGDYAGGTVGTAGDVDGDGRADILIGAQREGGRGAAYLIASSDFEALDQLGADDNEIRLAHVGGLNRATAPNSYRFLTDANSGVLPIWVTTAGDVDGDGRSDLLIGDYGSDSVDAAGTANLGNNGKLYLILAADLAAIDAADNATDGSITLANVAAVGRGSYEFRGDKNNTQIGYHAWTAGDVDGDGRGDFMVGGRAETEAYLVLGKHLAAMDVASDRRALPPGQTHQPDNIIYFNAQGVICFSAGTLIQTDRGARRVEDLRPGDGVVTLDRGVQPLRWAGSRLLSGEELSANPHLCPIRIAAGALGPGLPERELIVSPQHRLLLRSAVAQRMFGSAEVLAAARHLLGVPGVEVLDPPEVAYFHLLFDAHEIIFANGAPAESLHVDAEAMRALSPAALAEIAAILPDCPPLAGRSPLPLVRTNPRGRRLRAMTDRHLRNRKPLCA
jgi:hypothetical protein